MSRSARRRPWRLAAALAAGALLQIALAGVAAPGASGATTPTVRYVGTFNGVTPSTNDYPTIQAAVDAAKKGDWILVAPGDYHEQGDMGVNLPSQSEIDQGWYGGVDIETAGLHLRGMDRSGVVVDGTKPGSPQCSSAPADQETLPNGDGRNGIMVWKAKGVSVENLTVCNFIEGAGGAAGNEVWWNGGAGSGKVGLKGYSGTYLTTTSTYFVADPSPGQPANTCTTCAMYGIFASNAKAGALGSTTDPTADQLYANNMADSGIYVGACLRACAVTIDHAWMENSALGYSGTNSGGQVIVENSTFDDNKDGFDTNTALTGDPPPPQDGRCPGNAISPISGTNSCWVFMDNLVANNNNANVPVNGSAGLGPTGAGMTVSGGRNDTIMNNRFLDNGAWGILFAPYPDGNTVSDGKKCTTEKGIISTGLGIKGLACLFDPSGDVLKNNQFSGNGSFANQGNADFGNLLAGGNELTNCFSGNTEWDSTFTTQLGMATSANALDGHSSQTPSSCGTKTAKVGLLGANTDLTLLIQAECDAGVLGGGACTHAVYPQTTAVVMQPVPSLPSMPNPCTGAPTNVWCRNGVPVP